MSDNGDNDESSNSDVILSNSSSNSSNSTASGVTSSSSCLKQRSHQEQQQYEQLASLISEGKKKSSELSLTLKSMEHQMAKMQHSFHKATSEVNDTYQFCLSLLEEMKSDTLKELDDQYNSRLIGLTLASSKIQESIDKMDQLDRFTDCFRKFNPSELLSFKQLVESRLRTYINFDPEISKLSASELEFVSNFQAIRSSFRNSFGYIRCSSSPSDSHPPHHQLSIQHQNHLSSKQPPISRPNGITSSSSSSSSSNSSTGGGQNGSIVSFHSSSPHQNGYESILKSSAAAVVSQQQQHSQSSHRFHPGSGSGSVIDAIASNATTAAGADSANANSHHHHHQNHQHHRSFASNATIADTITNMYEKWSIGGSASPDSPLGFHSNGSGPNGLLDLNGTSGGGCNGVGTGGGGGPFSSDPLIDMSKNLINGSSTAILPLKSQIKRTKMIYHCKFGEFGVMEGQFTEPSGVAVNAQNDIIVADTNNHRIQIFDKEGRFKFQFGECGKRDGQLLYPNRVAVVKQSGDIIVTERSPTHQIQIYNQYGQFVRKFGANILQHPRGVTVDHKGRIIVVECKVMRVLIFDQSGNVMQKFGCSKHLEFPNGVVVNDKQEIFISDNRAHCVKVFSYEGNFLRQIGGEGLTNYPIGVCINDAGEILVADNHNNFNITIFSQDGQLLSALESKVKHAQCFDVALMDDNSVVLASKDYRIYIYRYLQLQSIAQAVAASGLC